MHRHYFAVFANQFTQTCLVFFGEIYKLGDADTAFRTGQSSRGQFVHSQSDQLVLCICSGSRLHVISGSSLQTQFYVFVITDNLQQHVKQRWAFVRFCFGEASLEIQDI